ncbi:MULTISPECIES: helix-turn-helix domain-containing protein [Streptomyces]|nr:MULTISPECIES: helix-turn-helix transcriptional regulator [Streptomyces]
MDTTGHDWKRLGGQLRADRLLRGLEQQAVARKLGAGRSTIRNIENGHISTQTPTLVRYAALLGWPDGAIDRVLAGGEPEPSGSAEQQLAAPSDLSARIQRAISDGVLVDDQVVTVPIGDGEFTATIVVRGERPPTDDELRQWGRQMRAVEDALRNPPPPADTNAD